ncbi:low molecular weight phosphatase family protein [Microbacterium sp. CJ88]|uniref:arsenate-mycothiol transferase ArsC n=1 Tax=Microbacterium sp. CJ88 TaxID=3445672 RepID=UPI003F65E31A
MSPSSTVLFICQHNAGRSQLGAHLLNDLAVDGVHATSGGVAPADRINPVIVAALAELAIDTGSTMPRAVTAADLTDADIVVTMKPGLHLPGPVAGQLVEWEFPDPDNWEIEGVRDLRDRILAQVRELAAEL